MVNGIDKIWAADLADMKAFEKDNDGYTFLLLVIDIFSKYGWIVPLKNKKGVNVAKALENIFQERKPGKLWTDKGAEFYNKDVKKLLDISAPKTRKKAVSSKDGLGQ